MLPRRLKPAVLGWAMYDFANSAFATSILSVIFSVYFASVLVPKEGVMFMGRAVPGESLWGYLISSVMFFVILLSPSLGAWADRTGSKRALLIFWAVVGSAATIALFAATPGRLRYGAVLAFLATLGFEMSLVFYNAFINDIADTESAGRVSGLGFALGYIGGGLCLALNMAMIARPEVFSLGGTDKTLPVRASLMTAGVWWLFFSLPTFVLVKDKPVESVAARIGTLASALHAFRQLKQTFLHIWAWPDLRRFLLAFLVFDDGIQTILLMASIFGAKALGFSTAELSLCFLMIQFVAFIGALVMGRLADSWGHKNVVMTTLMIYAGVVLWGMFMRSRWEFWLLGVVVGLIMGGSQAAARSLFALLIPAPRAGEFFAFFSIVGKAAALVGPFVFGVTAQFFGLRAGVGSLLIFFVIGGAILATVDENRGRQRADAF